MTFALVNPICTRTATISIDENNILSVVVIKNVCIDYEDAIDNALVMKTLTQNKPSLKLIDMSLNCSIDKKAQKFIDSVEIKQNTIARAVIKGSVLNRIALNFFMKLNRPETPTKIFSDRNEAYKWLLNVKKENETN